MLHSLATFPLLTGLPRCGRPTWPPSRRCFCGSARMVEAHHEIAELDLNPVVAGPDGALVVDARIRVRHLPPARPWPSAWKLGDP